MRRRGPEQARSFSHPAGASGSRTARGSAGGQASRGTGQLPEIRPGRPSRARPRIKLDIRYATPDNFLSTPVYSSARAFLQRPAAAALLRAHRELIEQGYGLLIFDAYRPWYVTKMFWDATPPDKHEFVANPSEGSRHNRGCAVDLSLYDLKTGREVEMTGVYDEMSERSYPDYAGGTAAERSHRQLLRRAMEKQGFTVFPSEWWHFDYQDWKQYAIQNVPFEQIAHK